MGDKGDVWGHGDIVPNFHEPGLRTHAHGSHDLAAFAYLRSLVAKVGELLNRDKAGG